MKDGFYLSAYLHIDKIAHLMKYHIRHDQNMSLWKKEGEHIELLHVWEMERISGLKKCKLSFYSVEQVKDVINSLLSEYSLTLEDMNAVIGTPGLDTVSDYHSLSEYPEVSYHSVAHLFSSMLSDTDIFYNENMIAIAVDGGPDTVVDEAVYSKDFYCSAISKQGKVEMFNACSPGFLWTYLRKKTHMEEGSLMALATASNSVYLKEEEEMVRIYQNGDLQKAYFYIDQIYKQVFSLTAEDKGVLFNGLDERFFEEENKISMIAKKVQAMSLRIMDDNLERLIEKSGLLPEDTYIAISGGYGLNCPTNSYLMQKYKFKGFLSLPCINDAGISVGMGLYYFYKHMERIDFKFKTSYYGDQDVRLESVLKESEFREYIEEVSTYKEEQAVADLLEDVILWFDKKAEIGPRALGHRSILGNPKKLKTRDRLNEVKQRQWWRPVAPIILYDYVEQWFEGCYYSPYMLHTLQINKDKEHLVPAICHLDGSARIQTIKREDNPAIYDLVKRFYEQEGVPIICNTSLNDKGEPIIDTIEECLNFALRKGIRVVYINKQRIVLKNHEEYPVSVPHARVFQFDFMTEEEKEKELRKLNPYNLSRDELIYLYIRPELKKKIDITKKEDVSKLRIFIKLANRKMGNIPVPGL